MNRVPPHPGVGGEARDAANLLMLSLDAGVVEGKRNSFYYMLEEFHKHWPRVDAIVPPPRRAACTQVFGNVFFHPLTGGKPGRVGRIVKTAKTLIRGRGYDFMIAHDSGLFQNGRAAWRIFRATGVPYVSEIHHVPGYPRASNLRECVEVRLTRLYLRRYAHRHPYFRVTNAGEGLPFLKSCGVPETRIRVIGTFFIDLGTFRPMDVQKVYDVVGCGRLVSNKGFGLTLDAVRLLKKDHPDVRAAVVGGGPLRAKLEAQARAMGLADNVTFLGHVPTSADVALAYNRARVMVMSSYNEGGPRTTTEAMACGTPVVSTRVGFMKELIDDGLNGYLVDWDAAQIAERVGRLLDDAEVAGRMGEAGRLAVQPLRREDCIADYARACREMAAEWRGHADKGLLCAAPL